MVKVTQVVLAAAAKQLSAAAGFTSEAQNIPYRQLLLSATGADVILGDVTLVTANGVKVSQASTFPVSIGPFDTGPVKLSDLYAVGAGATLTILGVPF